MTSALDVAREQLARTKNISAVLDALVKPHQRVMEMKAELSKDPFLELDHTRAELGSELGTIEELLGRGLVSEAWSSISLYESRVALMLPHLRRLAGMKRGARATGGSYGGLEGIEERIISHDLLGAEMAMSASRPEPSAPPKLAVPTPSLSDDMLLCALCGRSVRADADLCPYCGWDPGAPSGECPECGAPVLLMFRTCPSCGKGLPPKRHEGRTVLSSLIIG